MKKQVCSLPDEVGAVAAERRLFEEARDERVFLDAVDVLLTQRSSTLNSAHRPPTGTGHRRRATVRQTGRRSGRAGGLVFVVDSVDVVTHLPDVSATNQPGVSRTPGVEF